jgi:nucleoside-diphosphate-sugar epimerase
MNVLVTGALGRVGTALLDHQSQQFKYVPFDRETHPKWTTIVGDISEYEPTREAFMDRDGIVHLAADSNADSQWRSTLKNNIIGGYNCLEACRESEVDTIVLASSHRVVGMYEKQNAPEIYEEDSDLVLDHQTPVRPDSKYATSKVFLEALGRYYVENYEYPKQVYVLRFGTVNEPKHDHPFGDAEAGVESGKWERGDEEYRKWVKRMKGTWHSRRDAATLIECCLTDDEVTFGIYYGVSDNDRRWYDIQNAKNDLGYTPQDNSGVWNDPPKK